MPEHYENSVWTYKVQKEEMKKRENEKGLKEKTENFNERNTHMIKTFNQYKSKKVVCVGRKMKKKIKDVVKKVVGISMLTAAVLSAVPTAVYAVFGVPSSWSGHAATPGSTISSGVEQKATTSSVMVQYSSGGSQFMGASVWASQAPAGSYSDVTFYTTQHPIYYVYKDSSSYLEVLNLAYETYGICYVKTKYVATASGNHSGSWVPDVS